jgi:hypothetical protein
MPIATAYVVHAAEEFAQRMMGSYRLSPARFYTMDSSLDSHVKFDIMSYIIQLYSRPYWYLNAKSRPCNS